MCIIELGGTVGDMESMPFVEALAQLRRRAGRDNFMQIHVSYVPIIHGEQKTKPTQHAIKTVRSNGMIPDLVRLLQITLRWPANKLDCLPLRARTRTLGHREAGQLLPGRA